MVLVASSGKEVLAQRGACRENGGGDRRGIEGASGVVAGSGGAGSAGKQGTGRGAGRKGDADRVEPRRVQLQDRLDALEARVRAALDSGDETDADRFDQEVRTELEPFMGQDRVNRYFDMFPASTDWGGVAFYVQRNP